MGKCCSSVTKDLRDIKKFLGIGKDPWSVPQDLGRSDTSPETIESIAELMIYFMRQMSGMLGATGEIKIKVKDANLTEEGDQEVELSFPNISEAIANLLGLALTSQSINSATLNASMRGLVQAGEAFTSAAVAAEQTEVIMEWLGFPMEKKALDLPLMFTPGETSPDKVLQESRAKVTYWEHGGKGTLQSSLVNYSHAAAIIRAALFERAPTAEAFSGEIKKAAQGLKVQTSDFDSFLERVERGFMDSDLNTETTPYGRPYEERPRVKKLDRRPDGGTNS